LGAGREEEEWGGMRDERVDEVMVGGDG